MGTMFKLMPRSVVGGLVLTQSSQSLKPAEWLTCHNASFTPTTVRKIPGWAQAAVCGDASFVSLLQRQTLADGTGRNIVGTTKHLYELGEDLSLTALNGTAFTAAEENRWDCAEMNGSLYVTNLADGLHVLVAGAPNTAAVPGAPKGKALAQFERHITLGDVIEGATHSGFTVANSGLDDAEDWDYASETSEAATDAIPGNDAVQRLLVLGNTLAIYKEQSLWLRSYVELPGLWSRQRYPQSIGLLAPFSVVDAGPMGHVWVGTDDLYRFDGQAVRGFGQRVWRSLVGDIEPTSRGAVLAFQNELAREIVFAYRTVNDSGAPQKALVWNYETNVFSTRDWPFTAARVLPVSASMTIDEMTSSISAYTNSIVYPSELQVLAAGSAGQIYRIGAPQVWDADGTAVTTTLESGDSDFGLGDDIKTCNGCRVDLDTDTGDNALALYVSARESLGATVTWQGPYPCVNGRVDFFATGRWFRFKFVKAGGFFEMSGYAPSVRRRGRF